MRNLVVSVGCVSSRFSSALRGPTSAECFALVAGVAAPALRPVGKLFPTCVFVRAPRPLVTTTIVVELAHS